MYSSLDKSLLVIYNYNKSTYKIREVMMDIASDNKISYYTVYSGFSDSVKITKLLMHEIGKNFSVPSLVIVQDNKVVDYVNSTDKNEIMEFLRDNEYID